MSKNILTVKRLIELLEGVLDQDLPVITEGCDCNGDAGGIEVEKDYIIITRVV